MATPGAAVRPVRRPRAQSTTCPAPVVCGSSGARPGAFAAGADIAELRERDADDALRAVNAATIGRRSWRALELTRLSLRSTAPDTTQLDITAQALLFDSDDKRERMTRFLDRGRD